MCRPAMKVANCPAPIAWLHIGPRRWMHEREPDSVFDSCQPDAHVGINAAFMAALTGIMTMCPSVKLSCQAEACAYAVPFCLQVGGALQMLLEDVNFRRRSAHHLQSIFLGTAGTMPRLDMNSGCTSGRTLNSGLLVRRGEALSSALGSHMTIRTSQ